MSYEHVRPDSLSTVVFGVAELDPYPVFTAHGRPIPGPEYADAELAALGELVRDRAELPLFPLPSLKQLARITMDVKMGCWELPVYNDPKGLARYGQMSVAGIDNPSNSAHRTMWKVFYGDGSLPNGPQDVLDHLCENKSCCYPRHLEVVTVRDNTIRGRSPRHIGQLILDYGAQVPA